jgi:SAM-dependent methyltransferase
VAAQPLGPEQAGRVYDRIGRLQDWQRFYEGPAVRDLEAHAGFDTAHSVFELGCGTGALAQRLLSRMLPGDARYVGVDVSTTMVELATNRIRSFGPQASVRHVSGRPPPPGTDGTVDRFVAVYVFDLLSAELAAAMLAEAARLLTADGLLCLVSLAEGATRASKALCTIWNRTWQLSPTLVGGCRPVDLVPLLTDPWRVDHFATLTTWAVTSQVVIASPISLGR